MLRNVLFVLAAALVPSTALAQWSVYGGAMVTAELGDRGAFDSLGTYPATGAIVGFRFLDAWSVEFHVDRGFGKSEGRHREEIFGHSTVEDRAGAGRSLYFTWKSRRPTKVGLALALGVSLRNFSSHRVSFTKTDPDDPYPVSAGVYEREGAAGWSGGVFLPIAIGGRWSIAPEVRLTLGLTGERGGYRQVSPGVRVMWGF